MHYPWLIVDILPLQYVRRKDTFIGLCCSFLLKDFISSFLNGGSSRPDWNAFQNGSIWILTRTQIKNSTKTCRPVTLLIEDRVKNIEQIVCPLTFLHLIDHRFIFLVFIKDLLPLLFILLRRHLINDSDLKSIILWSSTQLFYSCQFFSLFDLKRKWGFVLGEIE